ncbi:hypothetical protein ONS95_006504 [Cadophora gregata]|uniref:uncharacterized protein n=1 Tax=Cadophora gregata TaxID=51156 RepID=UPI0026DC7A68|nr:uncharacterized protein ONS95_006504 [Cadophora gregata]KAK0101328.1 hypothetical protein ONS95_006504 [Cadophora gregata]KAK0106661.1 hypothetical protein ONS96_004281 [Cadophora gregata f. sp. sojae]
MRFTTMSSFGLVVVVVMAGADMQIDFPGFLRAPRAEQNLQTFKGALGGVEAEAITNTSDPKRPFAVGGDTFTTYEDAAVRTCNNQKNACAKVANGKDNPDNIAVGDCDDQESDCTKVAAQVNPSTIAAAAESTPKTSTSAVVAAPKASSTPAAVAPAPVQQTSASQEAAPATTAAPVVVAQPTLHSSDEQFFYFCDP